MSQQFYFLSSFFLKYTSKHLSKFHQKFQNYYSYDDGSAEAAFGPTGAQSRLAVKFDAYEADSLIGVAMHFVPTVNDVSSNLFLITVWENDNGNPGSVLYEDDIFFSKNVFFGLDRSIFHILKKSF